MIAKLITKIFGVYARDNMGKDFEIMAKRAGLESDQNITKLCFVWFMLGHVNAADRESHFNKHHYGEQPTGGPH